MRKLFLTCVLTLLTFTTTFGQDKKEQFLLRGVLGVPQNTPINFKASGGVPINEPLKVYLRTNTDTKVRDNFLGWFKEWNEGEGLKYGLLEEVADLSTADVALVRFADATVQMADSVVTYETSTEIDPATRKPVSTPSMPHSSKLAIDIYSYIVVKDNEKLKVLRRLTDSAVVNSTFRTLTGGSMNDMARAQQEVSRAVNEGTIDTRGRKDSKVAGDKLRDEFFKLLRSRRATR